MKQNIYLLTLLLMSCLLEDPKEGVNTGDIIEWTDGSEVSVLANGIDRAELSIKLKNTDPNLNITFKTDQGFFSGERVTEKPREVTLRASGRGASVSLNSDLLANDFVVVQASVGGFRIERTVKFLPSYPSNMIVTAEYDTLLANQANTLRISFSLFRPGGQGKVSDGLRIELSQIKLEGNGVLVLPTFVETSGEEATILVRSATKNKGKVKIKATIKDIKGEFLDESVDVTLK